MPQCHAAKRCQTDKTQVFKCAQRLYVEKGLGAWF